MQNFSIQRTISNADFGRNSKYKFDWQDVIHGHIEVEAESGVEAEQIFRKMKLQERLNSSKIGVDKDTLKIKFVDVGFDDLRAIAVVSVILYHAQMVVFGRDWFSGGFERPESLISEAMFGG